MATQQRWVRPYADKLEGYDDIWEIRIRSDKVQYRPLGCFGPGDKVFTLLIGAMEKDNSFEPKNAPKIAEKRKKMVYQEKKYLDEYY